MTVAKYIICTIHPFGNLLKSVESLYSFKRGSDILHCATKTTRVSLHDVTLSVNFTQLLGRSQMDNECN